MNEAAIEREQPATTCHEQHEPMSPIPLHTAQLYGSSGDENSQSETKGGNQTKPTLPSLWSRWMNMSLDTWLYEVAAVTFSGLCFAATIITIAVYNGKPSPQLSYGLTLNTIVSILTTASKSSLAYFVSGAIGQLKWLWVRGGVRRPVDDLQSFDDASRVPFGSIIILFRHKGLSPVSLGAAVTVLSLVFDPFMQQILSYPVYQTPMKSSQATAKQTVNFLESGFTSSEPTWEFISFGVKAAVNAALWSDGFEIEPTCPTDNCTWPSFTSVGWCNQWKMLLHKRLSSAVMILA